MRLTGRSIATTLFHFIDPQLSLANIGDTFDVRSILFPLTAAGRGRSQGIELFAEKKFTDRWFGQANIAFSKTGTPDWIPSCSPVLFYYPFVVNGVGGYRLNRKWEFSARSSWLSGMA